MTTTAATRQPPTAKTGSAKALRAVVDYSNEWAALSRIPSEETVRLLRQTLGTRNLAAQATTFTQISDAFARIAALLQASESEKVLRAAKTRADIIHTNLVASKAVVQSGRLIEALGITRQALNKALKANRVFAVETGGHHYYPAFFADVSLDQRKVRDIAKALGDHGGWEKWLFFTTPKLSLEGQTPLERMKRGDYDRVQLAAAGFAQR